MILQVKESKTMWLITSIGFFSVVQKPGDKQNRTLTARSSP